MSKVRNHLAKLGGRSGPQEDDRQCRGNSVG